MKRGHRKKTKPKRINKEKKMREKGVTTENFNDGEDFKAKLTII